MSRLSIFQIFYDEPTRQMVQPEFTPCDNTENLRPDWAECWVIRESLSKITLNDNDWYGWLSPKFTDKTGLDGKATIDFLNQYKDENYDVIILSPFYGYTAFYKSPFEQGDLGHVGLMGITQRFFDLTGINLKAADLVMHSQNTVWSNYIIAKPKFWRRWLIMINALFEMAENKNHELYPLLTNDTVYFSGSLHQKVFIQERLTSALIAYEPWNIKVFDTFNLPCNEPFLEPFRNELIACDALKQAYVNTGRDVFLNEFYRLRLDIQDRARTLQDSSL